jgi:hypothetical protein
MKKYLLILVCFVFLLSSCNTTDTTVILPNGPEAAKLIAEKDAQIKRLSEQIIDIEKARAEEKLLSAKAASSVKGILKANEYQPQGRPTEAINEEAKVALKRLPADDPAETVEALKRAIEMIEGERDVALQNYAKAKQEAEDKKVEIAKKDAEIQKRDKTIEESNIKIGQLEISAREEKEKHARDIADLIAKKDKELEDYKKEMASKERRWWINATRIAGLGLIVIGVLVMFVLKSPGVGGGLTLSGLLIGLISVFIEWLTAQWWFPWLCGLILLAILVYGFFTIKRMWEIKKLDEMKTAAIQDFKDEAMLKDQSAWKNLEEHLKYRMGDKNSTWGKKQMKEAEALGLINLKGEEKLKEIDKKL